jgi:NhaP-type Na+/H+ or K+/H+ antiporter
MALTRITIGIQVFFAGVELPKKYLKTEFQSLVMLLLPIMAVAWFVCGFLIYELIPRLTFVSRMNLNDDVCPTDTCCLTDGGAVDLCLHYSYGSCTCEQYHKGSVC